MKKNVGNIDKLVRLLVALLAVITTYADQVTSPWTYVLYVVAAIMVLTAFVGTCPLWLMTGINTLKLKKKQ